MTTHALTSVLESHFSFDPNGEELLPGIEEATPVEIIAEIFAIKASPRAAGRFCC
jgi:hypothetical protein